MKHVKDLKETGTTVLLDDTHFQDCTFENCRLVYLGGDFGWGNTSFINCTLVLQGAPARTQKLLMEFGWKSSNAFTPKQD